MNIKELEIRLINLEAQVAALASRRTIEVAEKAAADAKASRSEAKAVLDQYDSMKEDILEQNLAFETLMTEILPEVIGGEE